MTYNDKEIKTRADKKIAAIMQQDAEVVFTSDNDTRLFSMDLAHENLFECPKFKSKLLEMGLAGKKTDGFIRLESLKWLTVKIYEAESDWLFEEQHP